jgi:hypothetical protein
MGYIPKIKLLAALRSVLANSTDIYYHGSLDDFTEFNKPGDGHHGKGYYFTTSASDAFRYAKQERFIAKRHTAPVILYTVKLDIKDPYDPLSYTDANRVANHFGLTYHGPHSPQFHYKMLKAQMIKNHKATESDFNEKIEEAGFDHIEYLREKYVVVFNPKNIKIIDKKYKGIYKGNAPWELQP